MTDQVSSTKESPTLTLRAFVLLHNANFPGDQAIFETLRDYDDYLPDVTDVRHERESTVFGFGEELGCLQVVDAPFEAEFLDAVVSEAWYWPQAAAEVGRHAAYIEVSLMGQTQHATERAVMLTYLVAAVLEQCEGIAVLWESSLHLSSADDFLAQAQEITPDAMPLMLWVHFGIYRDEESIDPDGVGETFSVITRGLTALRQREMEVHRFTRDPAEVLDTVFEVAHYLLSNQITLAYESTVEIGPGETVNVSVEPSAVDPDEVALVLKID